MTCCTAMGHTPIPQGLPKLGWSVAMLPTYAAHMLAYVLLAGPRAYRRALHGVAAQARIVDGHAASQHLTA